MLRSFLLSAILLACIALNQGSKLGQKSSLISFISSRDVQQDDGVFKFELTDRDEYYVSKNKGATWSWYRSGTWTANYTFYSGRNADGGLEVIIKRTDRLLYIRVGPTQVHESRDPSNFVSRWGNGRWTKLGSKLFNGLVVDQKISSRNAKTLPTQPKVLRDTKLFSKDGVYKFQMTDRNEYYISEDYGATWKWFIDDNFAADYTLTRRSMVNGEQDLPGLEVVIKRTDIDLWVRVGPSEVWFDDNPTNFGNKWGNGFWSSLGLSEDPGSTKSVFRFEMTDRDQQYVSNNYGATWQWLGGSTNVFADFRLFRFEMKNNGPQALLKRIDNDLWVSVGPSEVRFDFRPTNLRNIWGPGRWIRTGRMDANTDDSDNGEDKPSTRQSPYLQK